MYLTAGQYKGRKIEVPKDVKPTLSKVRESVFNMLNAFEFENNTFLDMFAGSGLMGLEAISRGFKVTALEQNKKSALVIKKNYKNIGVEANLIVTNSLQFKTDDKFDIIYLDPPWEMDYSSVILKAQTLKSTCGIIVVEYDKQRNIDLSTLLKENKIPLEIIKNKTYGRTLITLIK